MSDERFEVVFRGDVVAGLPVMEVKQRLAQLFNADAERIDKMFFGRPVVVKRNLDRETAEHYQSSLLKAGALVDIRKAAVAEHSIAETLGSEPDAPPAQDVQSPVPQDVDFDVAPVGADVLSPEDQKDFTPVDVDTSGLSVAEAGADVLDDEHKRKFDDQYVETVKLSLDPPE